MRHIEKRLLLLSNQVKKTLILNNHRSMRIGIAALVMIGSGIVLSGIFFFDNNPAANGPANTATLDSVEFDFILNIIPENGTVLQGTSININVSISYLQGNYENITLEASGIPADVDYVFSQSQGFPTNDTTFNSILTVYVSEAAPTDSYLITIKATSQNGKSYSVLIRCLFWILEF